MKAHLTAITRKAPSAPMMMLERNCLLVDRVLDFGSGKGFDADHYGFERFDPYYSPTMPEGLFDTITCNYVLNVIPTKEAREMVIRQILSKLKSDGVAYIAVRNDAAKLNGYTGKGTWQGLIKLTLPVVCRTAAFVIYSLMHTDAKESFEA